jgi:hypothetical protein
MMKEAVGR